MLIDAEMIVQSKEQLKWLQNQSSGDLAIWLELALAEEDTRPLVFQKDETWPSGAITDLFRTSKHVKFHHRFKGVVAKLVHDWSKQVGHWSKKRRSKRLRYFALLLVLVGRLKVTDAYEYLLGYANDQRFKGLEADREDIHHRILRVLVGLGAKKIKATTILFKRDMKEREYAAICYRGLYKIDLNNGMKCLPIIVQLGCEVNPPLILRVEIDSLIQTLTFPLFCETLGIATRKMDWSQTRTLLQALVDSKRWVSMAESDVLQSSIAKGFILYPIPKIDGIQLCKWVQADVPSDVIIDIALQCLDNRLAYAVDREGKDLRNEIKAEIYENVESR